MAVIDNSKNHVVASEAGENDGNVELGLLTNSQEKFILRDLNVQTHNHCNQTTKQFIYLQPHSNISVNTALNYRKQVWFFFTTMSVKFLTERFYLYISPKFTEWK